MGQYWIPVNLDKKEYIDPHKLGAGLKLWEQAVNFPGTPCALLLLTAAYYEKRGGGDLDLDENWHGRERTFPKYNVSAAPFDKKDYPKVAAAVLGRWAGDRIALVGDYAEDSDLAPEHKASTIYDRCHAETETRYADAPIEGRYGHWIDENAIWDGEPHRYAGKWSYQEEIEPSEFTDISEMVCMVIEHELQGKFEGDGWRNFVYDHDKEKAEKKGKMDMVLSTGGGVTEETKV
jgi:hypothetical protein